MKVGILDALLASAVLYGVGSYLFWVNKTLITATADAIFGNFQRQGADYERRRRRMEEEIRRLRKEEEDEEDEDEDEEDEDEDEDEDEEDEDEDEDLPGRVQDIDDVGKKCH